MSLHSCIWNFTSSLHIAAGNYEIILRVFCSTFSNFRYGESKEYSEATKDDEDAPGSGEGAGERLRLERAEAPNPGTMKERW